MTQPDVLAFLDFTDDLGIVAWLAGSWAAQAHDGIARDHDDLDLFLEARHAATMGQHLELRGFRAQRIEPWHVSFADTHGRAIDVRLFEIEGEEMTHGPDERRPVTILDGYGLIGERPVRVVVPGR